MGGPASTVKHVRLALGRSGVGERFPRRRRRRRRRRLLCRRIQSPVASIPLFLHRRHTRLLLPFSPLLGCPVPFTVVSFAASLSVPASCAQRFLPCWAVAAPPIVVSFWLL